MDKKLDVGAEGNWKSALFGVFAPIDRMKRQGKTMSGMPSTPRLLLAVLAVAGGRVAGEMTCAEDGVYGYVLQDEAKCWVPELNAEFAGKLDGCNDGFVYGDYGTDHCQTTAANINKGDKYKGPPMICEDPANDLGRFLYIGWSSKDDCTNGIKALMDVLTCWYPDYSGPHPCTSTTTTKTTKTKTTTTKTTITTTTPVCNGRPDPPSCQTEYAGKCNDVVIGSLVRENCPVLCGTCDVCNQGCIPKDTKRKDGQPDCCTEGRESLKCPGPAHYHCGVHALRSNQTAHTATAASAPPAEQ